LVFNSGLGGTLPVLGMVDGARRLVLRSGVTTPIPAPAAPLAELPTPALVVDLDRLERNLARAADYARQHGLSLRPHVKTHKSPWIAAEQSRLGAVGVTCATPREAELMSEVTTDLLVAYPPVGAARARRIAALRDDARVTVALDSPEAVEAIARAAAEAGREVGVYVELDLGMHRVGVPGVADAIALARLVQERPALRYDGLAFYPGHVREPVDAQDAALDTLSRQLDDAIGAMERAGVRPRVVSGGSTPTMWRSHEVRGMTEMRPGTYVYNDRTTAVIGACGWDDCAATVLATVVSTAVPGQAVIDAGTKSLGREPVRGAAGEGFGALLDRPEVTVQRMSEEHGVLDLSGTDWRPRVGDTVRVVPNHVCIVVHLFDEAAGVRGDVIEQSWPIAARGR
jgi:D-serine deaminase-like pyridoxal phosphate-dependent protein